jgi:hypothetical protein
MLIMIGVAVFLFWAWSLFAMAAMSRAAIEGGGR